MISTAATPFLAFYAKLVVASTLVLIFLGGLVTSWQAGMAVPDWPLSFGSLNPDGWWADLPVRLEHGHRIFAAFVGLLTTILCAAVWRNGWPLLWGALAAFALTLFCTWARLAPVILSHVGIWTFAGGFAATLLFGRLRRYAQPPAVRWLAFAAFVGVALQATFGGLRVTLETARYLEAAQVLRIVHGCVAQAQLCLLVALATLLSKAWREITATGAAALHSLATLAWILTAAVYVQLIFGATMRHLGAGLAIPTFPQASPTGSWLPAAHDPLTEINFAHTRFGALLVTSLAFALAIRVLRAPLAGPRFTRPSWLLLALVAVQLTLGVLVIWHGKPRTLTTVHVVNGALVLATSLLLALRLHRGSRSSRIAADPGSPSSGGDVRSSALAALLFVSPASAPH
jgi:cytochrome c oxidase assembly protein subunit 15